MKHGKLTRRSAGGLLAGAFAGVLTGCESILSATAGPPPRLYRLSSKSTYPPNLPDVEWQLVVEVPAAPASISSTRIGLMETPFRFNYYADANWVDRAPLMVQNLLIESFDNSNAIISVGPESTGLRPDFILKPELREFQAEDLGGIHRVLVVINGRLVQMPDRQIVAVEQFTASADVPSGELGPVIAAFDEALGRVMKDLVVWTLQRGQIAYEEVGGDSQSFGRPPSSSEGRPIAPSRPVRTLPRPPIPK